MPQIGAHRKKTSDQPQTTIEIAALYVLLLALKEGQQTAQVTAAKEQIQLQREIIKAKADQQLARLAQADTDLSKVVEKHKTTLIARLKARFPSLFGNKGEVVVNRSVKWLKANKSAALAAYVEMPMQAQCNWVALESALTADVVQAINKVADEAKDVLNNAMKQQPLMNLRSQATA